MNLDTALPLLAQNPAAPLDLAELALAVARDEYPYLDLDDELAELSDWAFELRPRLRGRLASRVETLCRFLFHDLGFHGNQKDYYDPRNSFFNEVLARRTGLPISLSIVAIAVGSRAGLNVVGVGLPGHFVAKAIENDEEILFDPFHGGRRLSVEDCVALVERIAGVAFIPTVEALAEVQVGLMIQRMLNNLKVVYLRQRDFPRAARTISRLIQLCPHDRSQRRDQGAALLQAGRPGQAIDPLRMYLESQPPPQDALVIQELLDQAKSEVARWN